MLIPWKITFILSFVFTIWFSSPQTALAAKIREKRHPDPYAKQEHLIRHSRDYDIVYPVEVDERGMFNNHVTSLSSHRRRRRSAGHEKGPFRYQLPIAGDMFNMNLHLNDKLLGTDFAINTFKEDGTVETTRSVDNCFLIGESDLSNSSVAINDCDGLAGMIKIGPQVYYIEPVLNHTLIKEKGFSTKPGRPHIVYKNNALLSDDTVDRFSEEWWDSDRYPAASKSKTSKTSEHGAANSRKKRRISYNSFVKFYNIIKRPVKVYYMQRGKRKFFARLGIRRHLTISTYVGVRWLVVDDQSGKLLHINNSKYYDSTRTTRYKPHQLYISVPKGTKFPVIRYPDIDKQPPKYIEVMATADETVVKYHGKKQVARYALTLMNIVSLIFRHKSIGVNIYFVVVRLTILQRNPREIKITRNPMRSLNTICEWGHRMRRGVDKRTPAFYDQTVFLTRKSFGPSGYAPVLGMCYRRRSCTLNDDDGFGSAFIVAHETGHTLGMEHDGRSNNCGRDPVKGSIMAALVRSRFDRYYWSSCSRKEVRASIGLLWCLDDKPFNNSIKYQKKLPGEYFTLNDQCEKMYGSGYKFCEKYARNPCRAVWCVQSTRRRGYCRTRGIPALEGSSCGNNKWCRLGFCVEVRRDGKVVIPTPKPLPKPVHGGWGKWSGYGPCSADCGTGVRTRSRKCNNPSPRYNGNPCKGPFDEKKLCFLKKCVDDLLSPDEIREQQCRTRGSTLTKLVKKWKRYDFSNVSLDCNFEKDLCSWSQSQSDNTNWKHISGATPSSRTGPSFDHTLGKGKKGKYLFFETSRPVQKGWKARLESKLIGLKLSCLKFYFHAYGNLMHMGQLRIIVRSNSKEKLIWRVTQNYGNRWILKEITLISENHPFMIIFEAERGDGYLSDFALDDVSLRPGACKLQFRPTKEENQIKMKPCSTYCQAADGRRNDIAMLTLKDGTRCYDYDKPHDVCIGGKCVNVGCDNKLDSTKKLDECGICGGTGSTCTVQKGIVKITPKKEYEKVMECPVGSTNVFFEEAIKSPNFLSIQPLGKKNQPSLNGDGKTWEPGRYRIAGSSIIYSVDEQGRESLKAVGAIQEPIIITIKRGPKANAASIIKYKFSKPKDATIVKFYWTFGKWSYCSKTCGPGVQRRGYLCTRKHDGIFVDDHFCRWEIKPSPPVRKCERRPCVILYRWLIKDWKRCSRTCGGGWQYRIVRCRELWRNKTVSFSHCRKGQPIPPRGRRCNKQPCPSQWHPEQWSECSVTCGKGVKTRNITCLDHNRKLSTTCDEKPKPPTTAECHFEDCSNFTVKKTVVKGLSCSFENGFCEWSNVKGTDDFDFKLWSGRTPSARTGASNDHTLKSIKGKYLYIEASRPRRRGDVAQLISPRLKFGLACIKFVYHMYGQNTGELSLYLKTSKKSYRLWHQSGDKGRNWKKAKVSVSTKQQFQIVFEAVRGRSYLSDICLDDVVVETGKCAKEIKTEITSTACSKDLLPDCKVRAKNGWCSAKKYKEGCCKSCGKALN